VDGPFDAISSIGMLEHVGLRNLGVYFDMAASALNFEAGRTQIHQVLAVKGDDGLSRLPLRPRF
jgi:cyclopropane fatty-acyl-phospholipid synthase-like methyltransferase